MNTRLTVQPEFRDETTRMTHGGDTRRNAWVAVFAVSALFWTGVALTIWHVWG